MGKLDEMEIGALALILGAGAALTLMPIYGSLSMIACAIYLLAQKVEMPKIGLRLAAVSLPALGVTMLVCSPLLGLQGFYAKIAAMVVLYLSVNLVKHHKVA